MALINAYCEIEDVRTHLNLTTTTKDQMIEHWINSASRALDKAYETRWYTTEEDETRYYGTTSETTLWLPDDLISVTSLATDDGSRAYGTIWEEGDYDLLPANAAVDHKPYTHIQVAPRGSHRFPTGDPKGIKVMGKFGYCALDDAPAEVKSACIILASYLMSTAQAPLGTVGGGDMSQAIRIAQTHPSIKMLMCDYVKVRVS